MGPMLSQLFNVRNHVYKSLLRQAVSKAAQLCSIGVNAGSLKDKPALDWVVPTDI